MTRRERMERRAALRREWAERAEAESGRRWRASRAAVDGIPMGQPVLVGHHSERHHRRALERSDSNMRAAVEAGKRAQHHEQKARGLEIALDRTIFSDDPNAVEALQAKVAKLEAQRERMKLVNKHYRAGNAEALAAMGLDLERLRAQVAALGLSWVRAPFESYQLTNLGSEITRAKKRIAEIGEHRKREAEAEAAGGLLVSFHGEGGVYIRLQWAERPPRETLAALKDAGFRWSGGAWIGRTASLPEGLHDDITRAKTEQQEGAPPE